MAVAVDSPHVGDVGTVILYNCATNIEDATLQLLYLRDPEGTVATYVASIYSSTYLSYTTLTSAVLHMAGVWDVQPYLETPSWSGSGSVQSFEVEERIR